MRIWRIAPAEQRLYVESYSPMLEASYTDELNKFWLPVDLVGAGGAFVKVGTVLASGGHAAFDLADVTAGSTLEWYAAATDCLHETRIGVQLLTRP